MTHLHVSLFKTKKKLLGFLTSFKDEHLYTPINIAMRGSRDLFYERYSSHRLVNGRSQYFLSFVLVQYVFILHCIEKNIDLFLSVPVKLLLYFL